LIGAGGHLRIRPERASIGWCAAIVIGVTSPAADGQVDHALAHAVARTIVKIEVTDDGGGYSLGTGTVVGPERVVTACHVTRRARSIHVLTGGLRRRASSQWADAFHDVCVLQVPRLDTAVAMLGQTGPLYVGEDVIAVGFTGGMRLSLTTGQVQRLFSLDGGWVVQTDAAFNSGASGGGLFDERGRLVAVLTFRARGSGPRYFAVPVEWFKARVDGGQGIRPVVPQAGDGPFWARPVPEQPFFMRADSLDAEQRWDELDALTVEWRSAAPEDAEPYYIKGTIDARRSLVTEAIADYRRAVELNPRHALAWLQLGLAHLQLGQVREARGTIPRLLAVSEVLARRLVDAMPEMPE